MLIYHSREQRAHVRKRDKNKCNHCGVISRKWDVDHIRPLVEQKHVKEEDLDKVINEQSNNTRTTSRKAPTNT